MDRTWRDHQCSPDINVAKLGLYKRSSDVNCTIAKDMKNRIRQTSAEVTPEMLAQIRVFPLKNFKIYLKSHHFEYRE